MCIWLFSLNVNFADLLTLKFQLHFTTVNYTSAISFSFIFTSNMVHVSSEHVKSVQNTLRAIPGTNITDSVEW